MFYTQIDQLTGPMYLLYQFMLDLAIVVHTSHIEKSPNETGQSMLSIAEHILLII